MDRLLKTSAATTTTTLAKRSAERFVTRWTIHGLRALGFARNLLARLTGCVPAYCPAVARRDMRSAALRAAGSHRHGALRLHQAQSLRRTVKPGSEAGPGGF